MRFTRWWQYGLFGGVVLSLATIVKVIRAVIGGGARDVGWTQAISFAVAIFVIGFMCGVVVWGGRSISRRFGVFG
jgi:hypothetical protein